MAIIFISPKKRQRKLIIAVTALLSLIVIAVFFTTFFPEIRDRIISIPVTEVSDVPEIKINFNAVNSEQVKNLELFEEIKTDFSYTAKDKNGLQVAGTIVAISKNSALRTLRDSGLEVLTIQQANIGRKEPFSPY
ncbi:MAG: hypothetical protein AAB877_02590 [Patescibacteria group bacterium]